MAISKLSTNYIDDIIDVNLNEHRRYKMTAVSGQEDTYELEDTTVYVQQGTTYNAEAVNTANRTINEIIDVSEDNSANVTGFIDGSVTIARAGTANIADHATTANSATTATTATRANTATSADNATRATTATRALTADSATSATTADRLTTARTINGVSFDGSADITIYDSTKVSNDSDFILVNQSDLTFTDNQCRLNDSRITANSLADVYFTTDTRSTALNADITAETYAGYVLLTATNTPTGTITATIHIRVA